MSQPGQQDLDPALASPGALEVHLATWDRRQRAKTRIHGALALLFFLGMGAMLWLLFENPSKGTEAIGAAVAFGLAGIVEGFLVFLSRAEGRAVQTCKEILDAKGDPRKLS